jgi:hypothetical protein
MDGTCVIPMSGLTMDSTCVIPISGLTIQYALAGGAQEKIDQKWPTQTSDHPNPEILTVNPQQIFYGLMY